MEDVGDMGVVLIGAGFRVTEILSDKRLIPLGSIGSEQSGVPVGADARLVLSYEDLVRSLVVSRPSEFRVWGVGFRDQITRRQALKFGEGVR